MSDTRSRKHLSPKRYASRNRQHDKRSQVDLKTPKQRRAAERRDWKRGLGTNAP